MALIGQFGVGFYSAYLVADSVAVRTRAAGAAEGWRWESEAKDDFRIEPATIEQPGTEVVLTLKDDAKEYLDDWRLRSLVRKYSDYVRYPIKLLVEKPADPEKPDGDKVTEWETINSASALWTRSKSDITDEQYHEFYKHLGQDWQAPLAWTHFRVEGTQELTGLLFIPSQPPFDLFERAPRGVRLFVRRVFIMDDCEELLPEWLRFVRGIVDSEDLPLNVSRELLQESRTTRFIRKQVVTRVLSLLEEVQAEGETERTTGEGDEAKTETVHRYRQFWDAFGRVLKEGVHHEAEQRERIAKLLLYPSTHDSGELTSLEDYVARMPSDQKGIYYVTGPSLETVRQSPHIEALTKRGYEVLLMSDPVDEWVTQSLTEFGDKKLIAAAKGSLDLSDSEDDKKARDAKAKELEGLTTKLASELGESVGEVRITDRLTDSPACLVTDEQGLSPHIERILRANGQDVPPQKRTLELNPEHKIVRRLQTLADGEDQQFTHWAELLYDSALVAEGQLPQDPARLAKSIRELMEKAVDDA